MKLLNTTSFTLTDFIGDNIPPYAILSHRWENGEVLYTDIIHKAGAGKQGYAKVTACCRRAKEDGYEWVWIDTVSEHCGCFRPDIV